MTDLLGLQRLLRDLAFDRAAETLPVAALRDDRPIPAPRRLAIHHNNTRLGLTAALKDSFPVVVRLVGDDFFAHLADGFIRDHPPRHPVLLEYGAALPGFIARHPVNARLPYLADVARLEVAWHHAYHAREATPIDPRILQTFEGDAVAAIRLLLHPSHRFVASAYPIDAIWRSNQPGANDEAIDLGGGGVNLLVYRPVAEVLLLSVDAPGFAFLMALAARQTLATAWEAARGVDRQFQLVPSLTRFLTSRLFVGVLPP